MHESPTPDRDLYALLGVDRGRTAIQLFNLLDGRLVKAKRDAGKGAPSMSPEEWDATVIGRAILGDPGRRRRYDEMLTQGRQPTWVELQQLAEESWAQGARQSFAPLGQKIERERSTRWLVIGGVAFVAVILIAAVAAFVRGDDDGSGSTAAAVDSAEVFEVGDRGTVLQADEAVDMTAVAPEAADIGLCGDRLCPSGHDPAVGPLTTGDIAVTWGDGDGQDHRVVVAPATGEIVDYVTEGTSTKDARQAVLVGKPERGWPGWDSNTLYRVGDDGEIIKGDLVYYETGDAEGTVWFISYQDRGTLFKGTVVKR